MKQKILNEARLLYNKNGLRKVTSRMICTNLEISLGSFSYHFSDKNNIIVCLYDQMLLEIEAIYALVKHKEPDITVYLDSHKQLFLIQTKYKFVYLNLFEILTTNSKINLRHTQLRIKEIKMAKQVIVSYMNEGILKKSISAKQIDRLINVGQILNNFWPIDSELSPKLTEAERQIFYMKICCGLLEPYLESVSLNKYHEYFDSLEKKVPNIR